MAHSLFDAALRKDYGERLKRLESDAQPAWGEISPAQLLAHLIDTFEVTFAERPVIVKKGFLSSAIGRWLILKLPLPKNFKAPPDFHQTEAGDFAQDRERVLAYIDRFGDGPDQQWGASPLLGAMSAKQWGKLHAIHLRHHLNQFSLLDG